MQSEQEKDTCQQGFVGERGNPFVRSLRNLTVRLVSDWNRQLRDIAHLFGMSDDRPLVPAHAGVRRENNRDAEQHESKTRLGDPGDSVPQKPAAEPKIKLQTLPLPPVEQKHGKLVLPPLPEKEVEGAKLGTIPGVMTDETEENASRLLPLPPLPETKPGSDSGITEFKPNVRTRLADPESAEQERLAEVERSRANPGLGLYKAFYLKCPGCKSEEVYAMNSDGGFTRFPSDLAWVCQRLFCERCTLIFHRPGRFFLAPKPQLRPADSALYDG